MRVVCLYILVDLQTLQTCEGRYVDIYLVDMSRSVRSIAKQTRYFAVAAGTPMVKKKLQRRHPHRDGEHWQLADFSTFPVHADIHDRGPGRVATLTSFGMTSDAAASRHQ